MGIIWYCACCGGMLSSHNGDNPITLHVSYNDIKVACQSCASEILARLPPMKFGSWRRMVYEHWDAWRVEFLKAHPSILVDIDWTGEIPK